MQVLMGWDLLETCDREHDGTSGARARMLLDRRETGSQKIVTTPNTFCEQETF